MEEDFTQDRGYVSRKIKKLSLKNKRTRSSQRSNKTAKEVNLVCDFSLIGIDSTMPFKVNVSFMPRLSSKVFYFDMFKSFLLFCLYGPRLCEPRSCQTESTLFLILHLKPLIAINQSFQEKNIHPQRKKFRMLYLN